MDDLKVVPVPEGRAFATGKRIIFRFILLKKYSGKFILPEEVTIMEDPKPASGKDEMRKWAERMGYHWAENTDPSVPFDGFLYRMAMVIAVKKKKIRYGLADNCIIENKFPEDVSDLRSLPVPPYVFRELWVRTQNERAYRRFYIAPDMTAEIEEITRDNYRNTHYREAYWKKAPYRIEIPLHREGEREG
jgi:hypothetical protein